MTELRKALHAQVEQIPLDDIDRLVDFMNRFLHPLESPASEALVFDPHLPEFFTPAELEHQRQDALAAFRASQVVMMTQSLRDAVTRLGIDLTRLGVDFGKIDAFCGWSSSGIQPVNYAFAWLEGRTFVRLSVFHLKGQQQVITHERFHISSQTQPELIYKVRVLTPHADLEKERTVRI